LLPFRVKGAKRPIGAEDETVNIRIDRQAAGHLKYIEFDRFAI